MGGHSVGPNYPTAAERTTLGGTPLLQGKGLGWEAATTPVPLAPGRTSSRSAKRHVAYTPEMQSLSFTSPHGTPTRSLQGRRWLRRLPKSCET